MKIKGYSNVCNIIVIGNKFKPEDEIWACAFEYTYDQCKLKLHQVPIKGKLMCGNTEASHNRYKNRGDYIRYFVPFKKNGKELSYSKAVRVESRCYATSEKECTKLYNELINEIIDWHKDKITEINQYLLDANLG